MEAELGESPPDPAPERTRLTVLCLIAIVAAVAVGFVGGSFRWCLDRASELRGALLTWSHTLDGFGWLFPLAMSAVGCGRRRPDRAVGSARFRQSASSTSRP